jgi:hypothetical protein
MKWLLSFLAAYLILLIGLLVLSIGTGYVLHRLMPSVDLGMGILIGLVATGFTIHFFARIMTSTSPRIPELVDEDEPPRVEPPRDEPPRLVWLEPIRPPSPPRKRKRK